VLVARFLHPLEHRLSCSIHIGPLPFHGYSLRPREDVERWSTVVFEFGTRQAVLLSDLERPLVTSVVFVVLLGGGGLPWQAACGRRTHFPHYTQGARLD
jgi:hypothetical protein